MDKKKKSKHVIREILEHLKKLENCFSTLRVGPAFLKSDLKLEAIKEKSDIIITRFHVAELTDTWMKDKC